MDGTAYASSNAYEGPSLLSKACVDAGLNCSSTTLEFAPQAKIATAPVHNGSENAESSCSTKHSEVVHCDISATSNSWESPSLLRQACVSNESLVGRFVY